MNFGENLIFKAKSDNYRLHSPSVLLSVRYIIAHPRNNGLINHPGNHDYKRNPNENSE